MNGIWTQAIKCMNFEDIMLSKIKPVSKKEKKPPWSHLHRYLGESSLYRQKEWWLPGAGVGVNSYRFMGGWVGRFYKTKDPGKIFREEAELKHQLSLNEIKGDSRGACGKTRGEGQRKESCGRQGCEWWWWWWWKRWVMLMASGVGEYTGDWVVPCFANGGFTSPFHAQSLLGWFQHPLHAWPWRGSGLQSPHKVAAPAWMNARLQRYGRLLLIFWYQSHWDTPTFLLALLATQRLAQQWSKRCRLDLEVQTQ